MMTRIDTDLEGVLSISKSVATEGNERLRGGPRVLRVKNGRLFVIIYVQDKLPDRCAQFKRLLHSFKVFCTVSVTFCALIWI